jgi:hypothetical protein
LGISSAAAVPPLDAVTNTQQAKQAAALCQVRFGMTIASVPTPRAVRYRPRVVMAPVLLLIHGSGARQGITMFREVHH